MSLLIHRVNFLVEERKCAGTVTDAFHRWVAPKGRLNVFNATARLVGNLINFSFCVASRSKFPLGSININLMLTLYVVAMHATRKERQV